MYSKVKFKDMSTTMKCIFLLSKILPIISLITLLIFIYFYMKKDIILVVGIIVVFATSSIGMLCKVIVSFTNNPNRLNKED